MAQLRDFGIYRLPDGHSYVAVRGGSGTHYLFDYERGSAGRPVFEVRDDGRVARWFSTGAEYRAKDLEDTGRTYDAGHGLASFFLMLYGPLGSALEACAPLMSCGAF